MNNLGLSLKKFFTNKNTVTIIGVVAILVILYFMYTKQIQKATKEIEVPVAKETIYPQTLIDSSKITTIKVAQAAKPKDAILSRGAIENHYTGVGVTVPKGSMFYKEYIVTAEELPGNWLTKLEPQSVNSLELERPYSFPVNVATTFGNSIQPGDYVDFYLKAYDDNKQIYCIHRSDKKYSSSINAVTENIYEYSNLDEIVEIVKGIIKTLQREHLYK